MATKDPKTAKSLGRRVSGFDEKVWTARRQEIIYEAVFAKFSTIRTLRESLMRLVNNGYILVEASPRDNIWGIGFSERDAPRNKAKWGQNLLGNTLTRVGVDLCEIYG